MRLTQNHENRLDNIRALAILSVVFGHSIILYSSSWGIYQPDRPCLRLDYAKRFINLYQMPLFFSLSGYLFAKTTKAESTLLFLGKKAKRILLPFFAIGLFWMIPIKLAVHYPEYVGHSYLGAVVLFLKGLDTGHLWYLPTLFCFFVIALLARKHFRNKLGTWIILAFMGLIANSLSAKIPGGRFYFVYLRYFSQFFWSFSAGALLCLMKPSIDNWLKDRHVRLLLRIIAIVCCLSAAVYSVFINERLVLLSSALIVITLYLVVPEKEIPVAGSISRNSFGLYLFHSPLIYITFSFARNAPPAVVVAINFLLWGTVAFFLTSILRKTPLKLVIGE